MTDQALQVVDAEIVLPDPTEIASSDLINKIAQRLWKLFPNEQKGSGPNLLAQSDMPLVAETSLSWGCNPLAIGAEYFAWKFRGKLIMMRHYAPLVAWAQTKEKFSHKWREWTTEEKEKAGMSPSDYVYDCAILTGSDERAWQERFAMVFGPAIGSGVEFQEAVSTAERIANSVGTIGTGRVEYSEVYDNDNKLKQGSSNIKGWVPGHDRAKIRALRDAIKARFGSPNRNELMEMRARALGISAEQVPDTFADTPDDIVVESPEIQARYRKIQERVDQVRQARSLMTPEEQEADKQAVIGIMRDLDRDVVIGEDVEEDPFPANGIMDDTTVRRILSDIGYPVKYHDNVSDKIFGKSIQDLNELERVNFIEAAKRRMVLKNSKDGQGNPIAVAVRIDRVPELAGKGITTRDEALDAIIAMARDLTSANKRFAEYSL